MAMLDGEALRAIDELRSCREITDLCHTYCRALDRVDEPLLRSVFHPDSTHHHDIYEGTSAEFCGFAIGLLKTLDRTQHHLGNVLIELSGDSAKVESYFLAYHRLPAGVECPGMFAHHDLSLAEDVLVGGRYVDRFERRKGVWKIAHRYGIHEWESWHPSTERHFPLSTGVKPLRSQDDKTYCAPARMGRSNKQA